MGKICLIDIVLYFVLIIKFNLVKLFTNIKRVCVFFNFKCRIKYLINYVYFFVI